MEPRLIFIAGCTASGKGSLGRELARRTGGEIISIDSMKVYRGMDIGTAKPSAEVRREVPHHLVDVVDPWEEFSVARFVELAEEAIADIHRRGKPIFVVGGTPLYVKALSEGLFEGPGANPQVRQRLEAAAVERGSPQLHESLRRIDPVAAGRIHPNDVRRIVRALEVHELTGQPISRLQAQWDRDRKKYECVFLGIRRDKEELHRRIKERVHKMIADGLVDEVRRLTQLPRPLSTAARQALGYAEMLAHLAGEVSLEDAVEMIKINTRQFAKSQRTWFKRFREIEWMDVAADDTAARLAEELMARRVSLWSA